MQAKRSGSKSLAARAVNDALDDLAVTYLMHLPTQEYTAEAQLFYAFEQAWWHYCDQHQRQSESLRGFKTLVQFVEAMIKRVPALRHLKPRLPVRPLQRTTRSACPYA